METSFTITLDESLGIVSLSQFGLGIASAGLVGVGTGDVLHQCIEAAKVRYRTVRKTLDAAIANES